MRHVVTELGGLRCEVLDATGEGRPELLVVLCHGYGAPGDDLVPLGEELLSVAPAILGRVRFLFPQAQLDLSEQGMPEGRAWWHIDMQRLMLMQQSPADGIARLQQESPPDAPRSRRLLMALVEEASRQAGVPLSRVVLGGFSQGAMLATDVALRLEEAPAALGLFSGTLILRPEWEKRAAHRRGLRVFQTHGEQDPILPFSNAVALRELLVQAGLEVEFLPFRGGHTIAGPALRRFAALIEGCLPAAP